MKQMKEALARIGEPTHTVQPRNGGLQVFLQRFLRVFVTLSALSATMWLTSAYGQDADCPIRSLREVVRHDLIEDVRSHGQDCDLKQSDIRGFSLYDRAALYHSKDIASWLKSNGYAKEGMYSKALIKLIQTGMRYLDIDAGVIDGDLGEKTRQAIKSYQKEHGFSVDGEINGPWLADFYRRLVKKIQQGLSEIGFDAGGADGIIGENTVSAMQGFRQERQMPVADYADLDDQLIYQLMMVLHEHHKEELAKRDAERKARQVAQEAARREQEAKARAAVQRKAEAERRAAELAAQEAERARQENEQRMQAIRAVELQSSLSTINIAPKDAADTANAQQAQAARAAEDKAALEAKLAAERAQRQAQAQREAAAAKADEERAKQEAAQAKAAQERAQREAEAAKQAAEKARREAQAAFDAVKRDEPVNVSEDIRQATQVQGAKSVGDGFQELSGILRHDGRSSCSVNGQNIDASWCESVYKDSSGKKCNVILTPSGLVVSFLCE